MEKLKLIDEKHNIIEANVICTFETEDNKNYILYTNDTKDSNGNLNIFTSYYVKNGNCLQLSLIPKEEINVVEDVINQIKDKYFKIQEQ